MAGIPQDQSHKTVAKIVSIRIIISNPGEDNTVAEMPDFSLPWKISGPLYPRHLKYLVMISDLKRECDSGS